MTFKTEAALAILKSMTSVRFGTPFFEDDLFNCNRPDGIKIANGSFRMTIVPKNLPFVIKTMRASRQNYLDFYVEMEVYRQAKLAGISEYFAEPLESFVYKGQDFILFEKADCTLSELDHGCVRLPVKTYTHREMWGPTYYKYIEDISIARKIKTFLDEQRLIDFHSENIGYSMQKNHAIFIDYGLLEDWTQQNFHW